MKQQKGKKLNNQYPKEGCTDYVMVIGAAEYLDRRKKL